MKKSTIIFGGLGAAVALAYASSTKNTLPPPPTGTPPLNTQNTTAVGPGKQVAGIPDITASSMPDYSSWKRAEWASWYKALFLSSDSATAKSRVWNAWTSERNEYKENIPSADLLEMNLATWRPTGEIGAFNVTANSTPVYDTWTNWYNNTPVWNCSDWVSWFDAMSAKDGIAKARTKFASAWEYKDNWSFGSNGWSCSQTCDFVDKMHQRGLSVGDTGMTTICSFTNIPANVVATVDIATAGAKNTVATLSAILPAAVVVAGAAFVYTKYQETKN